jgi:hypothetical protein
MKRARYDFYSLGDAVAFGVRPSLSLDENQPELYEVYVKLTNGNRVVAAQGGTRPQAQKALVRMLRRIQQEKALIHTLDDAFVDARKIVRVYLDAHANAFATIIEDSTGESFRVFMGDRDDCRDAVLEVTATIKALHDGDVPLDNQPEEDDPFTRSFE